MIDACVIGSANQDIFLRKPTHELVHHYLAQESILLLPEGAKIFVEELHYGVGGSAINVAFALHRLGHAVTPHCTVGTDPAGDYIIEALQQEHITAEKIYRNRFHKTGISCVIPSATGDTSLFVYRGANAYHTLAPAEFNLLQAASLLYCGPLTSLALADIISMMSSTIQSHAIIAHNPSAYQLTVGFESFMRLVPYLNVLILNAREARMLLESMVQKRHDTPSVGSMYHGGTALPPLLNHFTANSTLTTFCQLLHHLGPTMLVITDGARGVYVSTIQGIYYHPAPQVVVTNSVGAGDAFGATFCSALSAQKSIEEAMVRASMNSGAVLQSTDATSGLLTEAQLAAALSIISKSQVRYYDHLPRLTSDR